MSGYQCTECPRKDLDEPGMCQECTDRLCAEIYADTDPALIVAIRAVERDAIVAWLRDVGATYDVETPIEWPMGARSVQIFEAADAIERGEHLK